MLPPLQLKWIKCQKDQWCSFSRVDISFVATQGVYVIWFAGNPGFPGKVVYVGHGDVASHIKALRTNNYFINLSRQGTLYLTWASVPEEHRQGVTRYLTEKWVPLSGAAETVADPIAVNSPW